MKVCYIVLALLALLADDAARASPAPIENKVAPIFGGEFTQLDQGPIAIILTDSFQCSGVLVGEREILTAAHCVTGPGVSTVPNDEYVVIAGGRINRVLSRYYNSGYIPTNDVLLTAPYDLGMLILREPVTTTQALPILIDDPVKPGESAMIFGYGANEISGLPSQEPWENAKQGEIVVTDVSDGMISSTHLTGGASTCAGDSGGPSIQQFGDNSAVIGVLSIGLNRILSGNCVLVGDGFFSYVDLQSPISKSFLSHFPGVQTLSTHNAYVRSVAKEILTEVQGLVSIRSLAQVKRAASSNATAIVKLIPFADSVRASLLSSALKALRTAKRTDNITLARKRLRRALADLEALVQLDNR